MRFCEMPAGLSEQICGNNPVGRCSLCNRLVCSLHSTRVGTKLICSDCDGFPQKQISEKHVEEKTDFTENNVSVKGQAN